MKHKTPTASTAKIFQLHIVLEDIDPPVWRRILVPGNMSLARLHETLQIVMGWENSHLHLFEIGKQKYSDPEFKLEDERVLDERKFRLDDLPLTKKTRFCYRYDLGDDWRHEIDVEAVGRGEEINPGGTCLAGARRCPPEDCGGPEGYAELLEALTNPQAPEHRELLVWAGEDFDPEEFEASAINRELGGRRVGS